VFRTIPMYREALGLAYQVRGQVRLDAGRLSEARADLDRSRTLLEDAVGQAPAVPELRGDLGRTYALLARAAGRANEPTDGWSRRATEALRAAVTAAPESARDRQSLDEVARLRAP
jgi:hypothetical protein